MLRFKASFDYGCALDMRVANMLDEAGFAKEDVIFYIPSLWQRVNVEHGDEPLNLESLKLLDERFTIGSHTMTHPMLTRIPFEQACDEIASSKSQLQVLLKHEIDDFCYPRGYANDQLRAEVRKYYKRARNTLVGNLEVGGDPVWETPTVHVAGMRRKEYDGRNWIDIAWDLLREAIMLSGQNPDKEYVYHLWGHSWEIERNDQWNNFAQLLYMIKAVRSTP